MGLRVGVERVRARKRERERDRESAEVHLQPQRVWLPLREPLLWVGCINVIDSFTHTHTHAHAHTHTRIRTD